MAPFTQEKVASMMPFDKAVGAEVHEMRRL
jgi:hypothetical protein